MHVSSIIFVIFTVIGAIEKQKLVYILNRDAEARLTISSPLEAHKSNTLVYHTVGVDVGFENPMFACLEIDYEVNLYNFCIIFLNNSCNMLLILVSYDYHSVFQLINIDYIYSLL